MVLRNKRIIKTLQHAITQSKKRYDVDFTHEDIKKMSKIIRNNEAEFVRSAGKGKSIYFVYYQNVKYKVGFSYELLLVTTFLPKQKKRTLRDIVKFKKLK